MILYDLVYAAGFTLAAPWWLLRPAVRTKVLSALRHRMGREPARASTGPAVMIHAVSLGEMNATRALVRSLAAARPGLSFIISSTTETGFARAVELYGRDPAAALIRYPLDFSVAIHRVLDRQRPSVVVLMELEVWPNLVAECRRRGVPVVLINGRLTSSSFRGYKRIRPLLAPMFRALAAVCAQDENYAERFIRLGARPERVRVTGTMKFDNATVTDRVEGAADLASAVGLRPSEERIWVCGSTGPGEEAILLNQHRQLLGAHPTARLVLVPRKPERFDAVARLIEEAGFSVVRRSTTVAGAADSPPPGGPPVNQPRPIVLGDTMGELRKFYSLADVVFVGRTLVDLGPRQHGSDMIEPAALAKPVIVGPFTHNFAEAMNQFLAAAGISVVQSPAELGQEVSQLLSDPSRARERGRRAQEVVRRQQGATARHVEAILEHLKLASESHGKE